MSASRRHDNSPGAQLSVIASRVPSPLSPPDTTSRPSMTHAPKRYRGVLIATPVSRHCPPATGSSSHTSAVYSPWASQPPMLLRRRPLGECRVALSRGYNAPRHGERESARTSHQIIAGSPNILILQCSDYGAEDFFSRMVITAVRLRNGHHRPVPV